MRTGRVPRAISAADRRLVALLAASVPACGLLGPRSPKGRNEELNRTLLERLLESDSVTPVQDFDENAYFEELERLYGDLQDVPRSGAGDVDETGQWKLGDEEINPYVEFGQRIWVDDTTGLVTKPYPFPAGMGRSVMRLLQIYGDFEVDAAVEAGAGLPAPTDQRPDAAVLDLRENFDAEAYNSPLEPRMSAAKSVTLSDWVVVRARPEVMLEVERFIEAFVEDTRQIEIEAKIVEVTTSDTFDYGITPIDEATPIFGLPNPGSLINSIDYSFGNTVDATEAIFGTTAVFDGVEFNALLEVVATYENVSIISRPKVAVREGAQADIINTKQIPYFKISTINANGTFKTEVAYQDVGVQMYIIPRIVGESTVVLNIDIQVSQETGTALELEIEGETGENSILTIPEISERATRTIVRLEPGQAVILGGLISERKGERETKIPILGDIPLLGYLFKSRFTGHQQTNVLFFIRPRILQGLEFTADDF